MNEKQTLFKTQNWIKQITYHNRNIFYNAPLPLCSRLPHPSILLNLLLKKLYLKEYSNLLNDAHISQLKLKLWNPTAYKKKAYIFYKQLKFST